MKEDYSLYLIADADLCGADNLVAKVDELLDSGITCVQLRMKHTDKAQMISVGKTLLTILKPKKIPLIINDDIEVASLINADGLHIGQADTPYAKARAQLGNHKMIGLSISNMQEALLCQHLGVNYFGVGPLFHTKTKQDASSPLGLSELSAIVKQLSKPVLAIGGINESNISSVLARGVSGVAIASAILTSSHPFNSAKQFAELIACQKLT